MIAVRLLLVPALAASAAVASAQTQTHFHHVHVNSIDPAAAIDFYTTHLAAEKATFDGHDAVWTQASWLLFTRVTQPPPSEIVSPLFHIGWGAEDMKAEFERQIRLGTTFQTVLTDGVELFGAGTRDRNFFMYLDGPDHGTIEVQSAMQLDAVTFWIYPTAHARALYGGQWKGRTQYASNRGRVYDHFAVSVDDLDQTLARLTSEGVKVLTPARTANGLRSAFVQAPDNMEVEIVEGQAKR